LDQATEDFDEDDLYAAMDQLTGRWVGMEKQLYTQGFPQGVSLVLYDLTSVYFEGEGPAGISRYGHSRDHRFDRPQIILAVAADAQGVPLHLEVLRGNRGDTTTLQGLLTTLRRRFGIQEAVFVFDGGMSRKVNLAAVEALGLKYVTRLGATTLEQFGNGGQCDGVVFEVRVEGQNCVWADKLSLLPADHRKSWRPDIIEAIKDVHPKVIRWGGSVCDAGEYRWKNGIGDRDARTPFPNKVWGRIDSDDVGIDAFCQFCELVEAQPLVCLSCSDEPQSAADLVQSSLSLG
jgi:hypothetical protein